MVVMAPRDFMARPVRWFQMIDRFRVEGTFGPHSAYAMCARMIGREDVAGLDLSCLNIALNGAEPIDLGSLREFTTRFAAVGVRDDIFLPCYGIGECTSVVTRAEHLVSLVVDGEQLQHNRFIQVAPTHPRARTVVSVGRRLLDTRLEIRRPIDPKAVAAWGDWRDMGSEPLGGAGLSGRPDGLGRDLRGRDGGRGGSLAANGTFSAPSWTMSCSSRVGSRRSSSSTAETITPRTSNRRCVGRCQSSATAAWPSSRNSTGTGESGWFVVSRRLPPCARICKGWRWRLPPELPGNTALPRGRS